MALTIDQLNIELTADSKTASSAIEELAGTLERLKTALAPIANVNLKVSNYFNTTTKNITKAAKATDDYAKKANNAGKSAQSFAQKMAQKISTTRTIVSVFQNAANKMADWFNESNEYIETVNLFKVTMGDAADESMRFAESVSAAMGIDIADWMQYQGTFKNLTAGFGVASDKANIMSQNLTQLSYDLASFFNTDVETAFDKLSSAMSGQVKGLREFGIDTTIASLQEYALAQGIDASVRSMSQAEKSLLRYNYIMEKSIIMQGDMARTIITPANSLRILNAQLTQMKRALGNVVSVVVVQFIPYVQAMVQIITEAASTLAKFFGFSAKDFEADVSGIGGGFSSGFEDAEESLDGVSGKIKKIKKQLMGFDELNILSSPDTDSGAGAGGASGGGAGLDLAPSSYDFLKGLKTDKLDEIKEKLKDALKIAGAIGVVLGAWKIAKGVVNVFNTFSALGGIVTTVSTAIKGSGIVAFFSNLGFAIQAVAGGAATFGEAITFVFKGAAGIISGVLLVITGAIGYFKNLFDMFKNGESVTNILGAAIGGLSASLGAFLIAIGVGASVATGGIAALVVGAVAAIGIIASVIYNNWDKIVAWTQETCAKIGDFFSSLWEGIKTVWNTVSEWFNTNVITPVKTFFENLWNGIKDFAVSAWEGIKSAWNSVAEWFGTYIITPLTTFFSEVWTNISLFASECWTSIKEFFSPAFEWFSALWSSVSQTIADIFYNIGVIANGCWEIIKAAWAVVSEWFNVNIITPVKTFFEGLWSDIKEWAVSSWEGIKTAFSVAREWFSTNVITPVKTFFSELWASVKALAISAWEGIKSTFSTIGNWINTKVIQPVGNFFTNLWSGFVEKARSAWQGVKTVFGNVATFFSDTFKKAWAGIVKVFSVAGEIFVDIKDGIVSAFKLVVNGIIKGLNKVVSLPFSAINNTLMWLKNLEILSIQPFKSLRSISIPQIPLLAEGGIVDVGQMFIARESGPELVGSIGNKTAVANNDQIISGIENGVYRAMVAANATKQGGTQTIRIINEIDGDIVGEKVIQYHNGKVLQTGVSPLMV